MYWVDSLSSSAIAKNYHIPFTVVKVREKAQQNTGDLLQLDPEAFLNMMADMSDVELIKYMEQRDSEGMRGDILQAHGYLLQIWKETDRDNWRIYRGNIKHFLAPTIEWTCRCIVTGDYQAAVPMLRFISALSRHDQISAIFLDAQRRMATNELQLNPWLEKSMEKLWIS